MADVNPNMSTVRVSELGIAEEVKDDDRVLLTQAEGEDRATVTARMDAVYEGASKSTPVINKIHEIAERPATRQGPPKAVIIGQGINVDSRGVISAKGVNLIPGGDDLTNYDVPFEGDYLGMFELPCGIMQFYKTQNGGTYYTDADPDQNITDIISPKALEKNGDPTILYGGMWGKTAKITAPAVLFDLGGIYWNTNFSGSYGTLFLCPVKIRSALPNDPNEDCSMYDYITVTVQIRDPGSTGLKNSDIYSATIANSGTEPFTSVDAIDGSQRSIGDIRLWTSTPIDASDTTITRIEQAEGDAIPDEAIYIPGISSNTYQGAQRGVIFRITQFVGKIVAIKVEYGDYFTGFDFNSSESHMMNFLRSQSYKAVANLSKMQDKQDAPTDFFPRTSSVDIHSAFKTAFGSRREDPANPGQYLYESPAKFLPYSALPLRPLMQLFKEDSNPEACGPGANSPNPYNFSPAGTTFDNGSDAGGYAGVAGKLCPNGESFAVTDRLIDFYYDDTGQRFSSGDGNLYIPGSRGWSSIPHRTKRLHDVLSLKPAYKRWQWFSTAPDHEPEHIGDPEYGVWIFNLGGVIVDPTMSGLETNSSGKLIIKTGDGLTINSDGELEATGGGGGAVIDDTTKSPTSVWSSSKTSSEIEATAVQILVPEFSTTKSYRSDDLCIHDGKFYMATALTIPAGAWDASKWTEQTLHDVLEFYREAAVAWADIEDLGNVQVDNLANGQVLKYNSSTQRWENANESGGGGASELNDLSDVSIASPAAGEVLTYQIAASVGKWIASPVPTPWFELMETVPAAQDPTNPDTVSLVLRDSRITANSTVDVYTSVPGKNYVSLGVAAGRISISYVAGQSSFEVKVRVS